MASLSDDDVRHIAKLARLKLKESDVKKMAKEMNAILTYIDLLNEVDTNNVSPTAHVTGQESQFRDDAPGDLLASPDDLLKTTGLKVANRLIITPSAHG
jgi:aspartyl-tRNA(Asn)/glutamyl-tRNA(Gln) amidotransferase subunit C